MDNHERVNFGSAVESYEEGRREIPLEVAKEIISMTYLLDAKLRPKSGLDLGCGTGIVTRQLKPVITTFFGADYDIDMIRRAKAKNDGIPYVQADALSLPFQDNSFDLVTCFDSFHWFKPHEKAFAEVARVLKQDGLFYATFRTELNEEENIMSRVGRIFRRFYGENSMTLPNSIEINVEDTHLERFYSINTHRLRVYDLYSLPSFLKRVESMSNFIKIPEEHKERTLNEIVEEVEPVFSSRTIPVPSGMWIISARKK